MTKMVERVATNIRNAYFDQQMHHEDGGPWESDFLTLARAAFAALREPTAAMDHVGSDIISEHDPGWHYVTAAEVWRAMIDAALAESAVNQKSTRE